MAKENFNAKNKSGKKGTYSMNERKNAARPISRTPQNRQTPGGLINKPFRWSWLDDGGMSKVKGAFWMGNPNSSMFQQCDCRCSCDVPTEALTMPDGTLCPTSSPYGGYKFVQEPHPIGHMDDWNYGWGMQHGLDNCDNITSGGTANRYCHFEQLGVNDGFSIDFNGVETSDECSDLCGNHCLNNSDECGELYGLCGAPTAPGPRPRGRNGGTGGQY